MTYMRLLLMFAFLMVAGLVAAQSSDSTGLTFNVVVDDPESPVEVRAEKLDVDRDSGQAVFTGNVRVTQANLRMAADRIEVYYDETAKQVVRVVATGHVIYVTLTEEAESARAVYLPPSGALTMEGDVLVVQGTAAISGDRLQANLRTGEAIVSGNVSTIFGAVE